MPTSEYEDDEVEELYYIIEEILEEDGKGATNVIIMGDWNSVVGNKAYHNGNSKPILGALHAPVPPPPVYCTKQTHRTQS
jgi:hypothetical protein